MADPPKRSWSEAFDSVGAQGQQFNNPLSPKGVYFAYLSKEDLYPDEDTKADVYDILFEVIPWEWAINVIIQSPVRIRRMAPVSPASLFHIHAADPATLLKTLGLQDYKGFKAADYLAEGSWYLLQLTKGEGPIQGDLYNPDIDKAKDPTGLDYGIYNITGATLIGLPQMTDGGIDSGGAPPWETPEQAKVMGPIRDRLALRFRVYGKPMSVTKQPSKGLRAMLPAIAAPVDSLGIMDVGQGNCNMVIVNTNPVAYYDLGYPLYFFANSAPIGLQPNGGAYTGPIMQNLAANLRVILSHWDWDHWRLGYIANLVNIPWLVPPQPVGPSAVNFIATLTNMTVFPAGVGVVNGTYFDYYRCVPPFGAAPAMLLNNSGIALIMITRLPVADPNLHDLVLTGDANFNTLGVVYAGVTGITAVHHGSSSHGADQNLPPQAAGYNGGGGVVYSYGVYTSRTGVQRHAYGFPRVAAVTNYQLAGWTVENSTAEGQNINAIPPAVGTRGNVRLGDQTALNAAYNATAFFNFPNHIS